MLDGIRELIGNVMAPLYDEATLVKQERSENLEGDITITPASHACFAHEVSRSAAYRAEARMADDQDEIIVLASHLGEVEITTDDIITAGGKSWSVVRAKQDGPKSQWKVIGKVRITA